jgi:hypothetical protein
MVETIASRTACAPWPASAGPFLGRGPMPWPRIGGRCKSIVNRLARSRRVPIVEPPNPRIGSPSQWPAVVRSAASRGRWSIPTSGLTKCFVRLVRARGLRSVRPVRRHAL